VVIDQFLQAPILLALIIMGMALMQGEGISGMMSDMRREYMSTLIANCEQHSRCECLCVCVCVCVLVSTS
jgi:hypothetical protein